LNLSQLAAIAFLLALVAAPLVAGLVVTRRIGFTLFQGFLYVAAYALAKLLWRVRWHNELPLPQGQGAIVVCNHRSSVDPFFVQTATLRKVHWMVAREFCEHWSLRWFLTACEVIPVRRAGIDTAAIKGAMRLTAAGEIVGLLPEGRINMTEEVLLPARPGAALLALKTRTAVVPCYIHGSPYRWSVWSPLLMPARVEVRFGQPLDLAEFYGREHEEGVLAEAMRRILKGIADLAGQPDFQPQIAGRDWKPSLEDERAARRAADERQGPRGN
jgi:1-acyl-sn-glycerol-3-phosphate acyltransferase